MADIFISYASEDRTKAREFADWIVARGWSVWWDRKILGGQSYDSLISQELNAAKCVIVLWSRNSIESDWVKDEATVAINRRNLVPVLIDDVAVPLGFGRIQTIDLKGTNVTRNDKDLHSLLDALSRLVGPPFTGNQASTDHEQEHEQPLKAPSRTTDPTTSVLVYAPGWTEHRLQVTVAAILALGGFAPIALYLAFGVMKDWQVLLLIPTAWASAFWMSRQLVRRVRAIAPVDGQGR